MIYLACPYSHPDEAGRVARFRAANITAGRLIAKGHVVYSAISHTHPIAVENGLALDWSFWKSIDTYFLEMCDAVYVLKYPGWAESKGIAAEVQLAKSLGKPIQYISWSE